MEVRVTDTYRYVRIITPLPAAWLLIAIVTITIRRGEILDSISDYYGGPLRDVLVGALMACGLGMVAYKGRSKVEDYALNFAGVNAFFVALVSNSFPTLLETTRVAERAHVPVLVGSEVLLQNLKISVATLLLTALVFVVLDYRFMHWTEFHLDEQTRVGNILVLVSWAGEIALGVFVALMVFGVESIAGASIFTVVHFGAAALLVVNLSFAAASHAFPLTLRTAEDAPAGSDTVQQTFRVITGLMWAGIVVGGVLMVRHTPYATLGTEVAEILLFIAFWVVAARTEWQRDGTP
jgi:hypothetical protein